MNYTCKAQLSLVGRFEITLDGNVVSYTLKRSSKARLVWLNIKRQVGLTITVPRRYDTRHLTPFLETKSTWILNHLGRLCHEAENASQTQSQKTDTICYLGNQVNLEQLKTECGIPVGSDLRLWMQNEAARIILLKVGQLSFRMGLTFNTVRIRDQRSRWGSCSCKKNLNFNWRLIMAPPPALEYVVIHELCHLKEMNHSRTFWAMVEEYSPEWRFQRKWLNDHCLELNSPLP
jgi:predicted metal-dependent hydrolase